MRKYKKFVLPVMRIVLFVAGAAVGYIVMWQVLRAYPNSLAAAYKYVYCSGTGFLLTLPACSSVWRRALCWRICSIFCCRWC